MLTAREALRLGAERLARAGIPSPQLEMSLLLARALGVTRLALYTDIDRPLGEAERQTARALLTRRLAREPMAYILSEREFFGLPFHVTPDVLIPRPETEHLVEAAFDWLKEGTIESPLVVDIGTGSGAIAVAVAHACPQARLIATDISEAALDVARKNAERHDVAGRIEFRRGSLLEPIIEPIDLLLSNPPYIGETERGQLAPEVIGWEPEAALFSGDGGYAHLFEIIAGAGRVLRRGGSMLLECGAQQAPRLLAHIETQGQFEDAHVVHDLAGIARVVCARRAV